MSNTLKQFTKKSTTEVQYNSSKFGDDTYTLIRNGDEPCWKLSVEDYDGSVSCEGIFPTVESFEKNFDDIKAIANAVYDSKYAKYNCNIPKIIFHADGDYSVQAMKKSFIRTDASSSEIVIEQAYEKKVDMSDLNATTRDLQKLERFSIVDGEDFALIESVGSDAVTHITTQSDKEPLSREAIDNALIFSDINDIKKGLEDRGFDTDIFVEVISKKNLEKVRELLPEAPSLKM